MIEVKHLLRRAYIQKLSALEYLGVGIPVDDENLTTNPAQLPLGNSTKVQAYVLVENQTLQDSSPKCAVNQDSQLQLGVYTQFLAGSGANAGNYAHADLISNAILQTIFTGVTNQGAIELDEAQLWKVSMISSRHVYEEYSGIRVYRNVLIFDNSIKQNRL